MRIFILRTGLIVTQGTYISSNFSLLIWTFIYFFIFLSQLAIYFCYDSWGYKNDKLHHHYSYFSIWYSNGLCTLLHLQNFIIFNTNNLIFPKNVHSFQENWGIFFGKIRFFYEIQLKNGWLYSSWNFRKKLNLCFPNNFCEFVKHCQKNTVKQVQGMCHLNKEVQLRLARSHFYYTKNVISAKIMKVSFMLIIACDYLLVWKVLFPNLSEIITFTEGNVSVMRYFSMETTFIYLWMIWKIINIAYRCFVFSMLGMDCIDFLIHLSFSVNEKQKELRQQIIRFSSYTKLLDDYKCIRFL